MQIIQSGAFENCYGITSIISHAATPPTVLSGAFDGVGKDNFTVEVPEQSVIQYQTESGWSDFKRIEGHQDFGMSRRQMRALNAGKERTYTLRCPAGFAWSIAEKPDWVTVSPASGTGKTEVTVTIGAMPRTDDTFVLEIWNGSRYITSSTHKGRAGEIVFRLDDKDFRSTMKVEQYDYDYADGQALKVLSHTVGNGVGIVLTGDCYDAKDIATGAFKADLEEAVTHFFDLEPYKTYQDYFDVSLVFAESDDSGIGTLNTVKDSRFGSYIGENRMVMPDTEAIFGHALRAGITAGDLPQTLVILVDNTSQYEGVTYLYGDGSAIACCPKSALPYPYDFRGIVQHEAGGHGFGKLADEYIYHNAFISTCNCKDDCDHGEVFHQMKSHGWYRNLELTGNMDDVAWSHLIFHPQYSDKVDVYEGGYMHNRGVFRSEATSCMNNNIPYYSAISRQAMVERIKKIAGEPFSITDFYARDKSTVGTVPKAAARRSLGSHHALPDVEHHYSHEHGPVYLGEHPNLQ